MAKRLFFIATFLSCVLLLSMDWPLPEAAVVRNFGYNDRGRPVLGVLFEGEGMIHAADKGELIFSRSETDYASRLPSPLGAWTAIDHGDGLVSIYSRCQDDGRTQPPAEVYQGFPIAVAGTSGWSRQNGVYFLLYDRRERRWVNASMVINPLIDSVQPQILGIQLHGANDRIIEGNQLRTISQGRYAIAVNAVDTILAQRGFQLAPHRIVCFVNGEEAGSLSFETISARDGVLMVNRNGLAPAFRVYSPHPSFEIGEVQFNRGQAMLEIVVLDIAGNSRSVLTRMIVE